MTCQQLSFGFWKSLDFWSLVSRYFTYSLVSVHPQAPDDFHLWLLWKASVNMAGEDPLETRVSSSLGYTSSGMPESHNNSIFNIVGGLWLWSFPLSGCYQPKINTRRTLMISQNSVPAGNTVQRTAGFGGNFAGKLGHDRQFPQARFLPCEAYLPWQCLGLLAMSPQLSEFVEAELRLSEDLRFS